MELNRERIIRGLECCTDEDKKCTDCPRFGFLPCTKPLMTDALSLIKELTEENERLKSEVSVKRKLLDKAEVRIDCLEEVNKVLQADICNATMNLEHITKEYDRVKADAVRKMQERLTKEFERMHKSNFLTVEERQWIIDQIAKELIGG